MKRSELGTVLIGVAIAVGLAIAIGVWAHVLAGSDYSSGASNLLGILGTVPLIAALAVAAWARWHRTCAIPYCLRFGEHPVKGTLRKVCTTPRERTVARAMQADFGGIADDLPPLADVPAARDAGMACVALLDSTGDCL